MSDNLVTCERLAALLDLSGSRAGVLMLLNGSPDATSIQFVTYGRGATDKVEAHNLKEWIKEDVLQGESPPTTVHESFILDAAKNKERVDVLLAACRLWDEGFTEGEQFNADQFLRWVNANRRAAREAIAKATGT